LAAELTMTEHLVALCYILAMAGASFFVMAKPMTARLMTPADFARRRNLWFAVTLITFLAHSFWLALLLSAVVVAVGSRRESNPAAMYCALLFALPQFDVQIPGLGIINQLFEINHARTMALVLLLPAALRLLNRERAPNPRLRIADTLFLAYFGYVFLVNATADSITGLMRQMVYFLLDQALMYFVLTRSVTSRARLLDVMASFAMGLAVMGVVGAFETARHWLLYESLRVPLGVPFSEIGNYLMRETDDGGYLRAYTTAGHAIAFGFMCMVALTFHLALARAYAPRWLGAVVMAMLFLGLIAPVSRGPWLAGAIAIVLGLSFGPGAKQRLAWMAGLLPLAIVALLLHPQGQKIIDLLPFVGSVEAGNITYRTLLIDRAMVVFWQNPVFGSLQYIYNPVLEEMRQGQGIIDIVNSYLGVALAYGLVGLLLFVAPLLYALVASWRVSRRAARTDPDAEAAGRALATALLAVLLAIGAVSHIFQIPIVQWWLFSLCVAYAAHAPGWRGAAAARPERAATPATAAPRRAGAMAPQRRSRPT
jgi:O-antigen ligase